MRMLNIPEKISMHVKWIFRLFKNMPEAPKKDY